MTKTETDMSSNLKTPPEHPVTEHLVTDKDILVFAKQILLFLFVSFVLCILVGGFLKLQAVLSIAEVKIPIAFTLVVSYYFWRDRK